MFKFYHCPVIVLFIMMHNFAAVAQTQLEFGLNSYTGPSSAPTTASLSATMLKNTTGKIFDTYLPTITVNATWSDQQYNNVTGLPAGNASGSCFGAQTNLSAKTAASSPVFSALGSISVPAPALFTSAPYGISGTGIDTANNYGFNCFTTSEPLYASASSSNSRYYYSSLTLNFSRPVDNPVLHIAGMGDAEGSLGFSTELELQTTGVVLDKLSGNGVFAVTGNEILNSATTINAISGGISATAGAASGSVRVTGTRITTLVFKVYMRGDGGGSNWSSATHWTGDNWLLGVSMSTPVITGSIFEDANGLEGNPINTIDGTPTNIGGQLFVNLVDHQGNVVLCNPVESDGNYKFQDLLPAAYPANYSIVLSNTEGVAGDAAPAPAFPSGWVNTGEFLGAGAGNDGTVNGILPAVTLANASAVMSNALFGIEQLPNTTPKLKTYASNTPGNLYTVPGFTGTDPEQGALGSGSTFMVNTLPIGGTLYYDGIVVTSSQVIGNFISSKLTIDPLDATLTTSFTYSAIDAAGQVDQSPATITLNWSSVLAVNLLDFTLSKSGQTALLQWTTSQQENASYMEIERSGNGNNFASIKRFNATGNSFTVNKYDFTDESPLTDKNFYRLKFVSTNGSIQYSVTKLILFPATGTVFTFPNPVQSQLTLMLSGHWLTGAVNIEVYNQLGQKVLAKQVVHPQQQEHLDLHSLRDALYILKLTARDNTTAFINISVTK